MRAPLRAVMCCALAALAACGGNEVTVYTSADEAEVARPVFERFEREARDFHERVRECYLGMARSEPHRIRVVDASAPLVSVTAAVRSVVAGFVDRIAGSA